MSVRSFYVGNAIGSTLTVQRRDDAPNRFRVKLQDTPNTYPVPAIMLERDAVEEMAVQLRAMLDDPAVPNDCRVVLDRSGELWAKVDNTEDNWNLVYPSGVAGRIPWTLSQIAASHGPITPLVKKED